MKKAEDLLSLVKKRRPYLVGTLLFLSFYFSMSRGLSKKKGSLQSADGGWSVKNPFLGEQLLDPSSSKH